MHCFDPNQSLTASGAQKGGVDQGPQMLSHCHTPRLACDMSLCGMVKTCNNVDPPENILIAENKQIFYIQYPVLHQYLMLRYLPQKSKVDGDDGGGVSKQRICYTLSLERLHELGVLHCAVLCGVLWCCRTSGESPSFQKESLSTSVFVVGNCLGF